MGRQPAAWQRQLAAAIRDPIELLSILKIPLNAGDSFSIAGFPILVPLSFVERMEPGNRLDPLLLQVLPTKAEELDVPGFGTDPVGDFEAKTSPGLLQKYHGRALLVTTGSCAVHCRYCFRREYPYQDEPRRVEDWQPAIDAIRNDKSIDEVILSGGDPLMLTDVRLSALLQQVDDIPHVDRLRIHSRLPIVLPARVTSDFLAMFKKLRAQTVMVVHANHANEITQECPETLQMIVQHGIPVLNQAVLLRGINDSVQSVHELCRRLINIGVMPYYLHQLDRVSGAAHFEADEATGLSIVAELAKLLPGYAVPRFVREIPGELGKTLLQPRLL